MKFSILISTKNRVEDLKITLRNIQSLIDKPNVECVVYDDGSNDETSIWVSQNFPKIKLLRNDISKGYMYCRNKMLNTTQADFAISLDDDAHFLTSDVLEKIETHFNDFEDCGVIAFRILWSKSTPDYITSNDKVENVKSFVGCGHAWRMKAWHEIPDYPEWFEFYGEENYASLELIKNKWLVQYLPSILVQHRVELKKRTQTNKDFSFRYRRALRADWYNIFMFYPFSNAIKVFLYSNYMQIKKIFSGNFKILKPLILAKIDLVLNIPRVIKNRNSFSKSEFEVFKNLKETKIFWEPNK
ncbi:glycosyltransferase family 2 protein [Flavobacterium sp.]|uniref:glycosyltransferase family 2 protein n=1 Tax=Flavobacterium sp. TaxID=239 RepID=UPI0035AD7B40